MNQDLVVSRTDLHDLKLVDGGDPAPLAAGQVRMKVDRFAITANNITYGVFGDALSYWSFFPAEDGYGRIPVWGFADVIESACDGVAVGDRLYGYWPMSDELVVEPVNVSPRGFSDGIANRAELPPVYNNYSLTSGDPMYRRELEAEHMLLFPLFSTSFLLWDFVVDNDRFGGTNMLITSASSKTAIGTARLFHEYPVDGVTTIGLTSAGNVEFVRSLGIYDTVLSYEEIEAIPAGPTVLLDFSGGAELRFGIHSQLGADLKYSCAIGATHWDAGGGIDTRGKSLPGPKPEMFFAPAQIRKRFKEWGPEKFGERMAKNWFAFVEYSRDWMTVETVSGLEAAGGVIRRFLDRETSPKTGYIVDVAAGSAD